MAAIRQFYVDEGVPLRLEGDVRAPAIAWQSHRARLGAWLDALPDIEWSGPTRCSEWDVTGLVRHLASGSQFLGYTLHEALKGRPTTLLAEFDSHRTVQASAAQLGDLTPERARLVRAQMDASVDRECGRLDTVGWAALAEAPPGWLPAHLAVNHFLFDSWVHEYDLMLPRGEQPFVDRLEAEVVLRYVVGLASVEAMVPFPMDVRVTDVDIQLSLDVEDGIATVRPGPAPGGAAVVSGRLIDLIDRATGRPSGPVDGDPRALAVLDTFAALLSG